MRTIRPAQATDLVHRNTFLDELGDNLGLRGASLVLSLSKLNDLLVTHLGVGYQRE